MRRIKIETNSSYTPEQFADFAFLGFTEVGAQGNTVTIDINNARISEIEAALEAAPWCETYSEIVRFELVSYAQAKLELYDREVEFEADTLPEIESHIASSEMLTDALAGETERVWRIERTDGEDVY